MKALENISFFLILLSFVAVVVGLIRPQWVLMSARWKVFFVYSGLAIFFIFVLGYTSEQDPLRIEQKALIEQAEELIAKGDYEQAQVKAKEAESTLSNSYSEDLLGKVSGLIESDNSFKAGVALFYQGDFSGAYGKLSAVIEVDTKNYASAKDYITKTLAELGKQQVQEVVQTLMNGDLLSARKLAEEYLQQNPEHKELLFYHSLFVTSEIIRLDGVFSDWVIIWERLMQEEFAIEQLQSRKDLHEQGLNLINPALKRLNSNYEVLVNSEWEQGKAVLPTLALATGFLQNVVHYHTNSIETLKAYEELEELSADLDDVSNSFDKNSFVKGLIDIYEYDQYTDALNESKNDAEFFDRLESADFKSDLMELTTNLLFDTNSEKEQKLQKKVHEQSNRIQELQAQSSSLADKVVANYQALSEQESVIWALFPTGEAVEKVIATDTENVDANVKADTYYAEQLINSYEYSLIEAINQGDFSLVEPYLLPGSKLYYSQKELVSSLYDRGIKEELVDFEINDMVRTEKPGVYDVHVYEAINIIRADGTSQVKEFNWIYTVHVAEDELGISDIREE